MFISAKNTMLKRALLTSAIAWPMLCATAAQAQQVAPAQDETAQGGLEEIIVTAQRREQNLQQVPVAVTALTSETLSQRGINNTQDLMRVTPGLQVSTQSGGGNGTGSATFFLRGMGQQRAGNGSEPAVGIYIDDIYYPSLQGALFNIVDLEQVEVLRGPQGTLFGRNTIGGAIRYTSKGPSKDYEGGVNIAAGSYNRFDLTGHVNIPVGDSVAFRLTGGHLQRDGFAIRNTGGPKAGAEKTDLIRLQVRATPTDRLSIDLSVQYMESRLEGMSYATPTPVAPVPGSEIALYNASPAGLLNPYDARYNAQCARCQPGANFREFADSDVLNLGAALRYELSDTVGLSC